MLIIERFKFWLENEYFDKYTKAELNQIKDNPKEIEERFYKELEFGTGGLRGIIGAGANRMNIYTVRKASQGLANYICKLGKEAMKKGIVIAYDSRRKSPEFALEAAKVFAGNGIKAFLFDELRPTPELSFAVRYLNASAGIVITASHNPKEYNGYKVYGPDGAQLSLEGTDAIQSEINKLTDITRVNLMEKEDAINRGFINIVGKGVDDAYVSRLKTLSVNPDVIHNVGHLIKIVYTPLHGAGNKLVRRVLVEIGFENIIVVREQEQPDTEFSTVKSPNPEDKAAFTIAVELAKKENADLIIGTDPDCDRVGVMVKDSKGKYEALTGNQAGCLLMDYILSQKKEKSELPSNGFVVKTIVTTDLAKSIANYYGVELMEVLTGFKFIGEKIKEMDEFGDKKFLFGFEESYGYLAGTFVRDKDGVAASMLIAEMAAYYKTRHMSLYDALQVMFQKYQYDMQGNISYTLEGREGNEKIKNGMDELRKNNTTGLNNLRVAAVRDYLTREKYYVGSKTKEVLSLPQSNVLYYEMGNGSWFCIRPSGTEPKIKVYYGASEKNSERAEEKMKVLQENVQKIIKKLFI